MTEAMRLFKRTDPVAFAKMIKRMRAACESDDVTVELVYDEN
jgi:hypothetical protein